MRSLLDMFSHCDGSQLRSKVAQWILFMLAVYEIGVSNRAARTSHIAVEYDQAEDVSLVTFSQIQEVLEHAPHDNFIYLNIVNSIN